MKPSASKSLLPWVAAAAAVVVAIAAGYVWLNRPAGDFSGKREALRIGSLKNMVGALVIIADDRGFLRKAGLEPEIKQYPVGARAIEGLLAGDVDVAVTADMPIVLAGLAGRDFRILATISTMEAFQKIVARKDRGIGAPADLKGKRIATIKGTATHYFLHLFLLNYGLSMGDATVSFLKSDEIVGALGRGEVDAIAMFEPYVSQARQALGENAIVFGTAGLSRQTGNLITAGGAVAGRPEALKRLLQAIVWSEAFARDNPQAARSIIARRLGIGEAEVAGSWPDFDLQVTLSNELLVGLGNGARWAIANRITDATAPPPFRDYIHADALRAVKPSAVMLGAR